MKIDFMHVQELVRMGAKIDLSASTAHCHGVDTLVAAPVWQPILRASASLVIAALATKGETIIDRIYHLDRGYVNIEQKLTQLGASVERIS